MKAYLIIYNPDEWSWPNFEQKVADTQNNIAVTESWTCSNKNVELDDRIFLKRVGSKGRGIFAAGHCAKKGYDAPHHNTEKAAQGVLTNHIDVKFDFILDPEKERYLDIQNLKDNYPNQEWDPQTSGILINDDIYPELEKKWAELIGIKNDLLNLLKSYKEIVPDEYDGSYELVRETIKSYASLPNLDSVDFNDLDLLYSMTTTFNSTDTNKKKINNSTLPDTEKKRLNDILDNVWHKATNNGYKHGKNFVGMFNAASHTFDKNGNDKTMAKTIISEFVKLSNMNDDNDIYDAVKVDLKDEIKGFKIGSFSAIAHCLKPYTFPIDNSNQGFGNIFDLLGDVSKPKENTIAAYAERCKDIKEFRDNNLETKNYRIFDLVARMIEKVNYRQMFEFIKNYSDELYADKKRYDELLKKKTLDQNEVNRIAKINKEGKEATDNLKKLADYFKKIYSDLSLKKTKLTTLGKNKFAKQNNSEKTGSQVRDYLWYQLRDEKFEKEEYKNFPFSISLFIDKDDSKTQRVRICIEMNESNYSAIKDPKDKKYKPEIIADVETAKVRFDELKKLNIPNGLSFVAGSNEEGDVQTIVGDPSNIEKKVQLCKIVVRDDKKTNDEYTNELEDGFKKLIPYYEYVVGIRDNLQGIVNTSQSSQNETEHKGVDMDTEEIELGLNTILYGPPGTGKTYNTVIYAVAICEGKKVKDVQVEDYKDVIARYDKLKEDGRISFTTFHQSYGYEEFIEGIKPEIDSETNQISYPVKPGVFKEFCKKAKEDKESKSEEEKPNPYVFVIDEINRGNISKIFGELITLIEPTKRLDKDESMTVKLPYSHETFKVPNNVYILGTMNTADRSIAIIDTALRRRFDFVEMMPDPNILKKLGIAEVKGETKTVNIVKMLETINNRIEVLYDREHTIGHAFFTSLVGANATLHNLRSIFENKIMPLLQEYFYDDYEKIALVLGDNDKSDDKYKFIKGESINVSTIFKGNPDSSDIPEYKYCINKEAFKHIESYIEIYK